MLVLSGDTGRTWVVKSLAACQLVQLAYEVSLAELRQRPGYISGYEKGLHELKSAGLLVEQTRSVGPTVRLRHDLLDNYSMVRALLENEWEEDKKWERCRDLCRRCDKDCGWSLLATLVQAAHDWGDEKLKRELFAEFLFLLDHKKFGNEAMTRAWAVTHVLKSCFRPLFSLIIEALAGEPADSLDKENPAHAELRGSQLDPQAQLTQETASTLASAFMVLHTGRREDAVRAVPVLAHGLEKWQLKGRFLDALAKYHTNDALDAILAFARRQLYERNDADSLLYVARNLRDFEGTQTLELLEEILADKSLKPIVRRVAAEGINHMQPGRVRPPPRDEDEIVKGLEVRESDGVRYSDWQRARVSRHSSIPRP